MVDWRKHLWLCVLCISVPASAEAGDPQDTVSAAGRESSRYWVNAGFGAASTGIGAGASISVPAGRTLFTLRVAYTEEFKIIGPSPKENAWDIGFLAGYLAENENGILSGSAGLSLVSVQRRGEFLGSSGMFSSDYSSDIRTTVGIPLEIQLIWTPIEFLGIGIDGFGNLNPEKSYAGVMLMLRVGRLH